MKTTQGKRAAIYCRISSDRTGAGLGVDRQEEDCRKLAEDKGYEVTAVLVDNDLSASASSKKTRPEYQRLLGLMRDGSIHAVIAWHNDRLTRSNAELEGYIAASDRIPTLTVSAGVFDLSTPTGRMQARIVGAVAQQEGEHKADRMRRARLQAAEAGKPQVTRRRPYGFAWDGLTVIPAEAKVIKDMAARVLAGEGLLSISEALNKQGVPTSTGSRWCRTTVMGIMKSARVAGLRSYKGEVVGEALWDAILDRPTWEAVNAAIARPTRAAGWNARVHLLAGFVTCGACSSPMSSAKNSKGRFSYACSTQRGGCASVSIGAAKFEAAVVELVLAYAEQADTTVKPDHSAEDREIERLNTSLVDLQQAYDDGDLDVADYVAATKGTRAKLAEVTKARAKQVAASSTSPAVDAEKWKTLSLSQQRALIGQVLETLVVEKAEAKGAKFTMARVTPVWRS